MWRSRLILCLAAAFASSARASSYEILNFAAEEHQIHTREFKKVEVAAEIVVAPGSEPPALNLVQVNEAGEKLRFLGILVLNAKKKRWIRKVELLEREPGNLYFEIVPDAELEPFVKKPRPRAVIEVFKRPSLIEIIKGIVPRFQGDRKGASHGGQCPAEPVVPISVWKNLAQGEGLPSGAKGFSAPRLRSGKEEGAVAGVQLVIPRSQGAILDLLWEPSNLKNLAKTKLKVEQVSASLKKVKVEAKPIFFVTVLWDEDWERQAQRIVYRKTGGDDRLRHFCGWMEVVPVDEGSARVTLYEEVDAPGRSPEDVLEGHFGTIKRLLLDVQLTDKTR